MPWLRHFALSLLFVATLFGPANTATCALASAALGGMTAPGLAAGGLAVSQGGRVLSQMSDDVASGLSRADAAGEVAPQLGSKLEYFLGRATGNAHNIERSTQMLRQLERVGLSDTPATRQYVTEHLAGVLRDPSNIVRVQENGRIVRESLLMGPRGGLKFETVWEGDRLITGNLFGGP